MDPMIGMGLLGLAGAGINAWSAHDINTDNVALARETNALNEKLMRESWQRDDTAVQRRTADLKAAGMSPLLAAGGAAANSGPVNMHAPQKQKEVDTTQVLGAIAQGMQIKRSEADIRAQEQQMQLAGEAMDLQRHKVLAELALEAERMSLAYGASGRDAQRLRHEILRSDADRSLKSEQIRKLRQDYEHSAHNLGISRERGLRTTDSYYAIEKPLHDIIKQLLPF